MSHNLNFIIHNSDLVISKDCDLSTMHTFGVPWRSDYYCTVTTYQEAQDVATYCCTRGIDVMVLGGGSNILPTKNFDGLVMKNEICGREVVDENDTTICLKIGSGESWHDLVVWTVDQGYFGLENLALIPGTVGGAVVQNIGAYDVDLQRYIVSVDAINLTTGESRSFSREECEFEYRNSIFKKNQGQWMVTSLVIELSKEFKPVLTYASLQDKLGDPDPPISVKEVMKAVIEIRQSKLPDWNEIGTAGSFFGNPRINSEEVVRLHKTFPTMPVFDNYRTGENTVPAGWLIEQCDIDQDLKDRFLYPKHHLIVVNNDKNHNGTTGQEIYDFTQMIQAEVRDKFGIDFIPEVVIL